jgi:hypothetical protein
MTRRAAALLLCLLGACDAQPPAPASSSAPGRAPGTAAAPPPKTPIDKKGRGKNPEVFKKFTLLMEDTEAQSDQIKEDLEKKRGEAGIKSKLARIQKNLETARALQYRKDPEEAEKLDGFFESFLEGKLKPMEAVAWTAESGPALWEKLMTACSTCHGVFRD